ncbi:MAG: LPS assembly lipoprotein LptE [Cryomorphaceae bacterium]|jgi:outer membrane lipopolysaccharide assembly protein LptE/RlpB|nr:LPS assembly lipoprotein LptE [Cryomorphaceae bacterium]
MMKYFLFIFSALLLSACWPESFSFRDSGGMPVEWQSFTIQNLENSAPNCPLSFAPLLTEQLKDGVQNNTRLVLNTQQGAGEVNIEGSITTYQVQPVAIQGSDNATSNRLTMSLSLKIKIKAPKEEEWQMVSTRFADFSASANLADVEQKLFAEISEQMVQDLINKLYSNW